MLRFNVIRSLFHKVVITLQSTQGGHMDKILAGNATKTRHNQYDHNPTTTIISKVVVC